MPDGYNEAKAFVLCQHVMVDRRSSMHDKPEDAVCKRNQQDTYKMVFTKLDTYTETFRKITSEGDSAL